MWGKIRHFLMLGLILLLISSCDKPLFNNNSVGADIYEIKNISYSENEVNIAYPSLTGLSDSTRQNEINELLKSEAFAIFEDYGNSAEGLKLDVEYRIEWSSDNLLSVVYEGSALGEGAPYLYIVSYTVNINIEKGSKVRLKDYININMDFENKYRSYKMPDDDSHAVLCV